MTGRCPLIADVKWNFSKLLDIIDSDFSVDVYQSQTHRFNYWDESKNSGYKFVPPTQKLSMPFSKFLELNNARKSVAAHGAITEDPKWLYVQQSLVQELGEEVIADYMKFSLETALKFKILGDWDALSTNLLLCGPSGVVTPLHYDEQQNLFAQLSGKKRVRLFSPDYLKNLYPHPIGHPCDRQSEVVLPSTPGLTELESEESRLRYTRTSESNLF